MADRILNNDFLHRAVPLVAAFLLAAASFTIFVPPAQAATYVVDSTADSADANPGNGVCDDGAGNCTLRASIQETNASPGADTISFSIPVTDTGYNASPLSYTIAPSTELPAIVSTVILDGTTQPDYPGTPIIVIDGSSAGGSSRGLILNGSNSEIRGLVLSDFGADGLRINGSNNIIAGNYIGTDVTGLAAAGNRNGIRVTDDDNTIGGVGAADRNVVSGNTANGIVVSNADDNVVLGNFVGSDATGNAALGNGGHGINLELLSSGNTVGGAQRNVISGNQGSGIRVFASGLFGNVLTNNYVGLGADGATSLGNAEHGVDVSFFSARTTIGAAGAGNVISGNGERGINVAGFASSRTTLQGNYVGTNAAGTAAVPNGEEGVFVDTPNIVIGGAAAGEGNLISGNDGDGLVLDREDLSVEGNLIGTNASGTGALGNGGHGITVRSGTGPFTVGGTGAGEPNVIAHNGGHGIWLRSIANTGNAIVSNSIYSNGGLGIDLQGGTEDASGVTDNDDLDTDGGPNALMNYPVITSATVQGATATVDFDLDVPAGFYRIEFYANTASDPSGHGEGESFADAAVVQHTGGGAQSFSHSFPGTAGDFITALTIECGDGSSCNDLRSTSEFSAAVATVAVNAPPVLDPVGSQNGDENTLITFTATASDPNPGDTLTFSLSGAPPGALIDPVSGLFSWTPGEADDGVYVFDVEVSDDGSPVLSDSETITLTVAEVNTPPVLDPLTDQTGDEQSPISFTATASDPDPGDTLTFSLSGAPPGASIDPVLGVFSWTPDFDDAGVHLVDVVVTDDGSPNLSDTAQVTVTVDDVNRAPGLGSLGPFVVAEGTELVFVAAGTDPDAGNALTYSLLGAPAGAAIDSGSGAFSWTPGELHGPGVLAFSVQVTDDGVPSRSASTVVSVTITEVNQPPAITSPGDQNDAEGQPVMLALTATDPDLPAQSLEWTASGLPPGLSMDGATGEISGTLSFDASALSPYSVNVTATDSIGLADSVVFVWVVSNVNRAPVAHDQSVTATAGIPLQIALSGSDADGDSLTYSVMTQPAAGTLSGTAPLVEYLAPHGSTGTEAFQFTVDDGAASSTPATVTIDIQPYEPPVGSPETFELRRGETLTVGAPGVLANDRSPVGFDLTAVLENDVAAGSLAISASGGFVYTHDGSATSVDSFTYRADDGTGVSAPVTVTLEINVNRAPVAIGDTLSAEEDTSTALKPLDNDLDIDGDPLQVVTIDLPANGKLTPVADGAYLYTPEPNWYGTESLGYTVTDGDLTASAEITISVLPINDPPFAGNLDLTIAAGELLTIDLSTVTGDIDGDPLSYHIVSLPEAGAPVWAATGILDYVTAAAVDGVYVIGYEVDDGNGGTAAGTVTITVVGVSGEDLSVAPLPADSSAINSGLSEIMDGIAGVPSLDFAGMELLLGSVLQTFGLFRMPLLLFAGVFTVSMLVGVGRDLKILSGPVFLPPTKPGPMAVVLVARGATLPARTEPGSHSEIVARLDAAERDVWATGRRAQIGSDTWLEVETERGDAWVNGLFLAAQVPTNFFQSDGRIDLLVTGLANALESEGSLEEIAVPVGLRVAYHGPPELFASEELDTIVSDPLSRRWWDRHGDNRGIVGSFGQVIAAPLAAALGAYGARDAVDPTVEIPAELVNLLELSISDPQVPGKDGWRLFFDYTSGEPRLYAIWREAPANPRAARPSSQDL